MGNRSYTALLDFVVKVVQSRRSLPHEQFNPLNPASPKYFRVIRSEVVDAGTFNEALNNAVTLREQLHGITTESGASSATVLLSAPKVGASIFPQGMSVADKNAICESLHEEHSTLWFSVTRDGLGISVSTEKPTPKKTFNGTSMA